MSELEERCREILEWHSTGLLHGGEGGSLRAYAKKLQSEGVPENYALRVAESNTASEAMRELIATRKQLVSVQKCIAEFLEAEAAVEREADRAEKNGGKGWSSAPTVRRIHAVNALRALTDEIQK